MYIKISWILRNQLILFQNSKTRVVAEHLKVVWQKRPSSAEGTRLGRGREGGRLPLIRWFEGPPQRIFLNFKHLYVRF